MFLELNHNAKTNIVFTADTVDYDDDNRPTWAPFKQKQNNK